MRSLLLCPCLSVLFVALLLSVQAEELGGDAKRKLAQELISKADAHKEHSMRDVLRERTVSSAGMKSARKRSSTFAKHSARVGKDEHKPVQTKHEKPLNNENNIVHNKARTRANHEATGSSRRQEMSREFDSPDEYALRTWAEMFHWAINTTVVHAETSALLSGSPLTVRAKKNDSGYQASQTRAEFRSIAARSFSQPVGAVYSPKENKYLQRVDGALYHSYMHATDAEADVMLRALDVIRQSSQNNVRGLVRALLILEELCHGIDNGRDLHAAGGLETVVKLMSAEHAEVRASAAWTLGTCAQNNPTVQNASVNLGAVPVLVYMAADDVDVSVCSRALLALNALLVLSPARSTFEEHPQGIEALRRPLVEFSDVRATRRALNLAELLVCRNLELWKTQLEAWDLGPVIERLMRHHSDSDVRESAARLINALDGPAV